MPFQVLPPGPLTVAPLLAATTRMVYASLSASALMLAGFTFVRNVSTSSFCADAAVRFSKPYASNAAKALRFRSAIPCSAGLLKSGEQEAPGARATEPRYQPYTSAALLWHGASSNENTGADSVPASTSLSTSYLIALNTQSTHSVVVTRSAAVRFSVCGDWADGKQRRA